MLGQLITISKNDPELSALLTGAQEYAHVYLLAKQRQKGCDGMGELATLKEEFRDAVYKMIQYSKEKKYISAEIAWHLDSIAEEMERL